MNVYEQLQALKSDLQAQKAQPKTIQVIDRMLTLAAPERESGLSMSRLMVLRRIMQMPDALNDEDVRLDLIALEGDLEEAASQRSEPTAYEIDDRRPKLKKYYKKK